MGRRGWWSHRRKSHSHRVFVGELDLAKGARRRSFAGWNPARATRKSIWTIFPGTCVTPRSTGIAGRRWLWIDDGHAVPVANLAPISQLREVQRFDSLVTVAFLFGSEWRGRVFLFNPVMAGREAGGTALSAGSGASGGAGGLQRLSSASFAAAGGSGGAGALCARTCTMARCSR